MSQQMELSLSTFLSAFFYYVLNFFQNEINPDYNVIDTPQEQLSEEYDIIIFGGSTSGCILAERLSEITSLSILIMTGLINENAISDNPLLYRLDALDNQTTVPQRRACLAQGGRCRVIAANRLGGMSASNNMLYLRGTEEDYNHWAEEGNTDWSWSNVFPYFLKLENYKIQPLDRSPYHGNTGPMTVRYPRYQTLLRKEYIRAGIEFGWPQNDYNGRSQYGIDYTQLTLDGPTRLSTAQAYLNRIVRRRNLTFVLFLTTPRILINRVTKRAEAVEYKRPSTGDTTYIVRARLEIVLAMGTLITPKVLLTSGIGPREELRRLGVPQICDLPVGRYFQDQPGVDVYFEIDKPFTITTKIWRSDISAIEFGLHGEGPLTTTGEEANAFFNSLDRNSTSSNAVLRFFSWYPFTNRMSQNRQIITVRVVMLNPRSFGNLTLPSVEGHPVINPNFFQEEYDYAVLEAAAKAALEFMKTPTMMKYSPKLVKDFQPRCQGNNEDEFIKCLIPNYSTGTTQGVGTARMGSVVTQDQLFVRGIKNLRVADDSVLPYMIRGNPIVAKMMIAERAADLVKNYYGLKNLENPIYPNDYNFSSSSSFHSSNKYATPGYHYVG